MPPTLRFQFHWRRQLDGCRAVAMDEDDKVIATVTLEFSVESGVNASVLGTQRIEALMKRLLLRIAPNVS